MWTKIQNILSTVPTTNTRIVATILIIIGTAIKYWASVSWIPDGNWLMFLAALAGIDTAHFFLKRNTAWKPDADDSTPPTS